MLSVGHGVIMKKCPGASVFPSAEIFGDVGSYESGVGMALMWDSWLASFKVAFSSFSCFLLGFVAEVF